MQIETERLILREMNEEDFDDLYCVLADSDIMQHYPYTFDEKRVRGWIEKNQERYQIFGFGLWLPYSKNISEKRICERSSNCRKRLGFYTYTVSDDLFLYEKHKSPIDADGAGVWMSTG